MDCQPWDIVTLKGGTGFWRVYTWPGGDGTKKVFACITADVMTTSDRDEVEKVCSSKSDSDSL